MELEEIRQKKNEMESLIDFNSRIHCPRVAAKWQRELDKLER